MMQSAGHTTMHCGSSCAPTHSVHLAGSMMYLESSTEIALFGHFSGHASHEVQSSFIVNAISISSIA
jgi:hypothetical protein